MKQTQNNSTSEESVSTTRWIKSLCFWPVLLFAVCLYGIVELSPRWVTHIRLRQEFHNRQIELISLEAQAQHLDKLQDALVNDEQFRIALAQSEIGLTEPIGKQKERVELDETLKFQGLNYSFKPSQSSYTAPYYLPVLELFATTSKLRWGSLSLAAFLIVFAFSVLHEGPVPGVLKTTMNVVKTMWRRYFKPRDEETSIV